MNDKWQIANRKQKNDNDQKLPVAGIYYTMAVIGPALGYVIGGELLKLYTDFLIIDSST